MMVVFTGPASIDDDGVRRWVLREELEAACAKKGITVQKSLSKNTNLVVASRTDTQKYLKAIERGIPVMSYWYFIQTYLGGEVPPMEDAEPGWVDHMPEHIGPAPGIPWGNEL